ncbi:MerR family transcriptional regulator [Alkalihalobacillus sp. AL-G]|uniref:MerR family transcriptional regulator n=1 Tax=Alkalihalobacillus sp. AL-G TaxID=2926399 RepID=UPI00272DA603|nr:MerR family transcriptional regulator [Alkalihalobacillus sp. AL-G]WLD91784.1 MerR family transcriptional regulator [Alkalihalobacillus sp. AL-G]
MGSLVKTKAVSKKLGVNPTTIQRWVKYFEIPCPKNEHGHYLFREEDIQVLSTIQKQLQQGLQMSDIKIQERTTNESIQLSKSGISEMDERFKKLHSQLDILEKKVSQKADEVLSYQVLQHRKDLDHMATRLTDLEEKMVVFEEQLLLQVTATNEIRTEFNPVATKQKRNWLLSLFSL